MPTYTKDILFDYLINKKLSYCEVGRIFGISGNAIKKAAKRFGIPIQPKRVINPCENFSHPHKQKIDDFSDDEFTEIINTVYGGKNLIKAFGYSYRYYRSAKESINIRCEKLGLTAFWHKPSISMTWTKGEVYARRKNYQSYRSAIRQDAYNTYIKSGYSMHCLICGYSHHVEIAHIKPVSSFNEESTFAEINSIENLVGLCPNHHWEFDNGLISVELIMNLKDKRTREH